MNQKQAEIEAVDYCDELLAEIQQGLTQCRNGMQLFFEGTTDEDTPETLQSLRNAWAASTHIEHFVRDTQAQNEAFRARIESQPEASEYDDLIAGCVEEIKARLPTLDRGESFTIVVKRSDPEPEQEDTVTEADVHKMLGEIFSLKHRF